MDFEVDANELNNLCGELGTAASTVKTNVDLIYEGITKMNEAWSGPSYDEFKAKADEYRKYLDAMCENYSVWQYMLHHKVQGEIMDDFFDSIKDAYDALGGE